MAPKKRSQTPRHQGVNDTQHHHPEPVQTHYAPSTQPDSTPPSTTTRDRRRKPKDNSIDPPIVSSNHSPTIPTSPHSPIEGIAFGSHSRRESTSTMRTSSISLEGHPSCTPTGRISKAKKGKRVHACEFPGCGKVFTRAEHRRRHELNHNPEALFPCTRPGCRKAFHRIDLLQRHQERHDLESAHDASSGHLGRMSQVPVSSDLSSVLAATSVHSPSVDRGAPRSSSGGLSIGSLVHPQTDYRYLGTPAFSSHPRQSMAQFVPGFPSSDDSGMFYTPESSQSPVSEYYGRYPHRQSISSSSSVAAFDPSGTSPLISGNMPGTWVPSSAPPSMLPSNVTDDGAYLPSPADSSLPIPLSDLDGYEWSVIRRELSSASGILPGNPSAGISDTIRWDCLDLYWQYFHPHFPVVHRPTFLPTKPSPLLASAMAAIGSQYDSRPDAKFYSLTLLDIATKLLRRRDSITSRSRLADLQTVFLLEVLSKYCARRVEVEMSARFRSLFASLDQARRSLATDPLAVFRTLRKDRTSEDIHRAHKFWLEHETRRRILQASMVLDLQQVMLFEQPPTIVQHGRPSRATGVRTPLSLPCPEGLWEISSIETWVEMASNPDFSKPRSTRNDSSALGIPLDYFQVQVSLASTQDTYLDDFLAPKDQLSHYASRLEFTYHAREMARNTPIRQLLVVSGESWIMGKKLENESEFQNAKKNLRVWVESNIESRTAVWHALRLIRGCAKFMPTDSTHTGLFVSLHGTQMLHEPWVLYVAALVCWAYGVGVWKSLECVGSLSGAPSTISEPLSNLSRTSSLSSVHPALLDSQEAAYSMREFLHITNVEKVEDLSQLDPHIFGQVHGVLEMIRLNKIGNFLGGLMNDAERVLYRLVEGRSRLSHF
ncbi:hypothetical protein LTR84_000401 [Exophiala bonariae]|uniref:C2H2-type domain-containing protein n=1 Tax=Exophiala bonariae TaxID=1690606 RepID=A0AAV9NU64_9EURO|nr:hypothetical protein LTR84_000401 [Exophiala bonariae]